MKHLSEYTSQNVVDISTILESANGVVLLQSNNLENVIKYLQENQPKKRCIIADSDDVRSKYPDLDEWFCNLDDVETALFFLKTNGKLCMYEPVVLSMSDEELEAQGITRIGEKYTLPYIKSKLEATSKAINSSKTDLKIWPDEWDKKYKIQGVHKINSISKLPANTIDFKTKGAYLITDFDEFRNDLYKSFELNFGSDSVITQLFAKGVDISKYLAGLKGDDKKEISKVMANVLSEPLAILAVIDNVNNIREILKGKFDEDLGELKEIIIPIAQNWPVADFYAHFENLPDRLIAISVKSNGSGNSSTIMGCLPVANIDNVSINDDDRLALLDFFNEIIPQFETENKVELKLSEKTKNKIQNVSLYALSLLKEETSKAKSNNILSLVNSFENLVKTIKPIDKEFYKQLHKISELAGTNVIEKIFVCLFNANKNTLNCIKNAVGDATSCYKITVNNSGKISCIKQSPEGEHFRLIIKLGGQGLKLVVNDGKLVDVVLGHKTSQGQWLGYTFK